MRFALRVSLVLFLAVGAIYIAVNSVLRPRLLFERLVVRPIPQSVHNIKTSHWQISTFWARLHGVRDHASVLRFEISREDLSRIVAARGLSRVEDAKCTYGKLSHTSMTGRYILINLYSEKRRDPPKWFDLDEWTNIETYLQGPAQLGFSGEVAFLLYDEQRGSAYFIRWQYARPPY